MTTASEGQELTRVGPGTPMGELMRQYWLPAIKSSELLAGGDPLRLMLLGEKLIAFRDTAGRVGVMDHRCPHRCASLFYGRNEEGGMRCVYHGWKFATDGQCLEQPNLPPDQDFSPKVRAKAYQVTERAGVIWVYMGARAKAPPMPDIEATLLPDSELTLNFTQRECNWLQALEGDIDTSHFSWLHVGSVRPEQVDADNWLQYQVAQPGARVSGRGHRLGHDVLRLPPGRGGRNLLALRTFWLPVLDVHSAGRFRRPGDRARLGADG